MCQSDMRHYNLVFEFFMRFFVADFESDGRMNIIVNNWEISLIFVHRKDNNWTKTAKELSAMCGQNSKLENATENCIISNFLK